MHFCNLIKVKIENFLNARRTRAPTATLDRIEEFEITKEVPPTVSHYSVGSLCVNLYVIVLLIIVFIVAFSVFRGNSINQVLRCYFKK